MMRILLAAIVLAFSSSVAVAQDVLIESYDSGRIDPFNEEQLSRETSYRILETLSHCMTGQNPKTVLAFLSATPGSSSEAYEFRGMNRFINACMQPAFKLIKKNGVSLSYPVLYYRGAFAEAALRRLPAWKAGSSPPEGISLMRHFEKDPEAVSVAAANRQTFIFYDLASCFVANNWSGAAEFLRTKPFSVEESSAVRKLSGTFGECLQPSVKVAVEPMSFRGILAEAALYALSPDQYSTGKRRKK